MSNKAIDYIEDKKRYGSNNSTKTMAELMNLLGNIQNDLKCIHIAGTNGKGSTSSFLASILQEEGYKVGMYTSPYIEVFNERIQINRVNISDEKLEKYTNIVKEKVEILEKTSRCIVTSFELITAIAFVCFYYEKVDYVVLETGVGGELDATNVIKNPLMSILTTIDYDHIKKLGPDITDIARHKSGIIKKDSIVCSYYQKPQVMDIIKNKAEKENSKLYKLDDIEIYSIYQDIDKTVYSIDYKGLLLKDIEISLLGKYQVYNSALSIMASLILNDKGIINISINSILLGVKKTKWLGRVELLRKNPYVIVDGAHNKQGAENLKEVINLYNDKNIILVMAMLEGKNNEDVVRTISSVADKSIITQIDEKYRRLSYEDLKSIYSKYKNVDYSYNNNQDAIKKAFELAKDDDLIIFTGSLYFVGEVRKKLGNNSYI